MKSILKTTIYASLGLLSDGTVAMKKLGKALAKRADISEAEGERFARKLQADSSKAVKSIRRTLDAEVTKVARVMHAAIEEGVKVHKSRRSSTPKTSPRKHGSVKHKSVRSRGMAA